jgi:hypothetical protein
VSDAADVNGADHLDVGVHVQVHDNDRVDAHDHVEVNVNVHVNHDELAWVVTRIVWR